MTRAEKAAGLVLAAHGPAGPPVDPAAIADTLGVQVIASGADRGIAGMLLRRDGHSAIGVNATHPEPLRRWHTAHQLGHYSIHPGRPNLVCTTRRRRDAAAATDREEAEANRFAAALLAPEAWLRRALDDADDDPAGLADLFGLPPPGLVYRLMNLGLTPGPAPH